EHEQKGVHAMPNRQLVARGSILAAALLVLPSATLRAQDPVKVAPDNYKVASENAYVRVLDIHLAPGAKVATHSHPGYVAVALTPCKVKFTSGGKTQEAEFKAGEASWRDAETHSAENVGTAECHALNIEVKAAKKKAAAKPKKK